jgi:hypothetical protein
MAARRGVREELHLLPHQYELDLLAFHVVTALCQWGALFLALLRMSKKDLEDTSPEALTTAGNTRASTTYCSSLSQSFATFCTTTGAASGGRLRQCSSTFRWSMRTAVARSMRPAGHVLHDPS